MHLRDVAKMEIKIPTVKNVQRSLGMWNTRETKPYIVPFCTLMVSFLISLRRTHDVRMGKVEPPRDWEPGPASSMHKDSLGNAMGWYASQLTYQSQFVLLCYYFARVCGMDGSSLFAGVFPIALAVNIMYGVYITTQDEYLYNMTFDSFVSHAFNSVLIFKHLIYYKSENSRLASTDIMYNWGLGAVFAGSVYLNKAVRDRWTYAVLKMNQWEGWATMLTGGALVQAAFAVGWAIQQPSKSAWSLPNPLKMI